MCSVCAPFDKEIKTTFEILGYKPHNLVINPTNLFEIFQSILVLGKELDRAEEALKITNQLKERINTIKSILHDPNKKHLLINRPKVMCLDWLNPFLSCRALGTRYARYSWSNGLKWTRRFGFTPN